MSKFSGKDNCWGCEFNECPEKSNWMSGRENMNSNGQVYCNKLGWVNPGEGCYRKEFLGDAHAESQMEALEKWRRY